MMNTRIVNLFAIICAVLSVIIVTEWLVSKFTENSLLKSNISQNRKAPFLEAIPALNLKEKPEESYADLVNRPLFIKGRRPVEETSSGQSGLKSGSDSTDSFDWQLNGVYTTDQGLSALFSKTRPNKNDKDRFRKLKENEYLDGWKLTGIHPDKVILKQGGELKELLLNKPKPKELPKSPVQGKKPTDKEKDKPKHSSSRLPFLRKDKKSDNPSKSKEDSSENRDNE